jgi:hypothetical protein
MPSRDIDKRVETTEDDMTFSRFCVGAVRFTALMTAIASLSLASGCTTTRTMHADEHIRPYLRSLAKRPDVPLARTLTWKYHYAWGKGSYESAWLVADGKLVRNKKGMAGVQMYAAQKTTSGRSMSEVYTERAREASRAGRHGDAQIYHGLSEATMRTQIASENVALGMALGSDIQKLGGALLDAVIVSGSQNAATYVKEDRPPVISERAPEGTVLELFFRGQKLDGADAKPATVTMRWETLATLKDAQGKIWRSSASFTTYFLFASGSAPAPVPAEFVQKRLVLLDEGYFVPAQDDRNAYAQEVQEVGKIARRGGYIELGVTAAQAIDDIYQQIALAKAAKR